MSNDHRPPEGRHDERAFVNSADSHVVEPLDLWQERLPARLRDRAPRRIEQDGRWVFLVEGMAPKKMGSPSDDESGDADGAGHFRAGGFDPELRWACARAYNDWLAETFASASKRFAGAAMIPVHEVATAVDEIERVAGLGLRSVMLPMHPPPDRPYNLDVYDPIWAAAQDHGFPVSFHVGTGASPWTERGPGGAVINYVEVGLGAQRNLAYLAASGVLERFPELHVVMVECGAGWLAWVLERR